MRQRATLSCQRAPEMTAGRDRAGPPACTAVSAKDLSSDMAEALTRPKDSIGKGSKGRVEDNRR
jgi:hypothetical protein